MARDDRTVTMKRRRARENPSTKTWLFIGAGVAGAGVIAYFVFRPTPAAAAQVTSANPNAPQLPPAPQTITVPVGYIIKPPVLPALPPGADYWGIDPGTINTAPAQAVLRSNPDGTFTAVGPGAITIAYQGMSHGGAVGGPSFPFRIVVT
jgi:hypothetical protein